MDRVGKMTPARILIIAAAVGAGFYLLKKTGVIPAGQVAPMPSTHMPGDMWSTLMGASWDDVVSASGTVDKNTAGQLTTADGKPIGTGDAGLNLFQASNAAFGL